MLTLALLTLLASPQDAITYQGRAFVFQADLKGARAAGWIAPETSDETALDGLEEALVARLRGAGRFPEAQVLQEQGGRFAAVFVGDQSPAIEAMLIGGLADPGRVELLLEASEDDLEGLGTSLAAERERLAAWRAAHPGAPVPSFNTVPPAEGGPAPALRWLAPSSPEGQPVPAVRRLLGMVPRSDMQVGLRLKPAEDGSHGLAFSLQEQPLEKLERRLRAHEGRTLLVVLNDVAVGRRPVKLPLAPPFQVAEGLTLEEARPLMLACGIPLDAPLSFVERSTRELTHVKRRPAHGDKPFKREEDEGGR